MSRKQKANQPTTQLSLPRPPVVVILGHVDHGKTTLLDAIRQTDVAAKEYGGITQSIGAYQVSLSPEDENSSRANEESRGIPRKTRDEYAPRVLTFIDTPGHEAFTNMRSRGASVADIAVLVVAANDSVMPQTIESIKIIKAANIPYIVAINKIDLPEANVDKVIQDLLRHEVMLENYGGDIPFVKISAKKNQGIKELLELIILLAQIKEISGDPQALLEATVIESRLDKNRGPLASAIVRNGRLAVGEEIFVDNTSAKIRALIDYQGQQIREANPGMPVEILGLPTVPPVGSAITTQESATKALPEASVTAPRQDQNLKDFPLILKADTLGSLEAILAQIPANVTLVQSSVGEITEADILLAKSTSAVILGFNVKTPPSAAKLAENEKVLVKTYKIIYELLDELKDAAAGLLEPTEKEEVLGAGKIIAEFPFDKMRIAGTKVLDGRLARGDTIRVIRKQSAESEEIIGTSKIKSLRIAKEEVNKVEKPKECGLLLDPQVDFNIGDDIISYRIS